MILPLARPGLAVTAFYSFLTAWGEVAYAIAFMPTEEKLTLGVGLQQFVAQYKAEWGLLTASAVLITIPAGDRLPARAAPPGRRTHRRRHEGVTPPCYHVLTYLKCRLIGGQIRPGLSTWTMPP